MATPHPGMEQFPDMPKREYPEVLLPNDSIAEQRIDDVLHQSVNGELEAGFNWYLEANKFCEELGEPAGLDVRQTAAIVALLSPRKSWPDNQRIARQVVQNHDFHNVMGYSQSRIEEILNGANPDELILHGHTSARKVPSFYLGMAEPETTDAVTIDRHMWNLLLVETPLRIQLAKYTVEQYEWAEDRFRAIAERINVTSEHHIAPLQIQATVWLIWRRMHSIRGGTHVAEGEQGTFL